MPAIKEISSSTKEAKMNKVKVVSIDSDSLEFDNGIVLTSFHAQDCCELHYLSLADLTLSDFDGLEFDLTTDAFFERIEGYGIALLPLVGYPVRIPGYAYNNSYYSSQLDLVLKGDNGFSMVFDVSECQSGGE
jgi:hypothetical protein